MYTELDDDNRSDDGSGYGESHYETPDQRSYVHSRAPPPSIQRTGRSVDAESVGSTRRELFAAGHDDNSRSGSSRPAPLVLDESISLHPRVDTVNVQRRNELHIMTNQISELSNAINDQTYALNHTTRQLAAQYTVRDQLTEQYKLLLQRQIVVNQTVAHTDDFVVKAKNCEMPQLGSLERTSAMQQYLTGLVGHSQSTRERNTIVSALESARRQFDCVSADIINLEREQQKHEVSLDGAYEQVDALIAKKNRLERSITST